MTKVTFWSLAVALAGFLFGFDTIVISGVDQQLQSLWNSSDVFHGVVVMAMALWGTVIGAIFGGFPTIKYGRKNSLIGIGILFLISAIGSALADDPYVFAFFRFIGGIGVGVSTIAAPTYISEIAPANKRGKLVALYQFSIVLGILIALISNYLLSDIGDNSWRWMIGVEAIPAIFYCLIIFKVPKSPRWLLFKGRKVEAEEVLLGLNQSADIHMLEKELSSQALLGKESIFSKKYRFSLLLVFAIAFFNQFSGINAILYYAPRIFEEAGLGRSSALLSSVGIGMVNLCFTVFGMLLIDRFGRKQLMYIGSFGYIFSLALVAISFYFEWNQMAIVIGLFLFIASHAIGQGTVIWVFMAEIFPTHLRSNGQAFGSSVHWVLAASIPSSIPFLFSEVGPAAVFAAFSLMMVGQLIWVFLAMPETKGESLEALNSRLNT